MQLRQWLGGLALAAGLVLKGHGAAQTPPVGTVTPRIVVQAMGEGGFDVAAWSADSRFIFTASGVLRELLVWDAVSGVIVDRVRLPGLEKLGRRRSWLLLCQVLLTLTFFGLSMSDPRLALGSFALIAVIGAFSSATQDVVIDAWRIDVADEKAPVEILSSIYQF